MAHAHAAFVVAAGSSRREASSITEDQEQEPEPAEDDIEAESLAALDWPAICAQVAAFAKTPLGTEAILRDRLPSGRSQHESEQLLEQTAQAQLTSLSFNGVFDLRPLLVAVSRGRMLHPLQLNGVASTLEAAAHLAGAVAAQAALAPLLPPLSSSLEQLLQADIRHCIDEGGYLLGRASPKLAEVRKARQENRAELRTAIAEWARKLQASGISERGSNQVMRRNRQCVSVKAGRKGELPRGSVTLGSSNTGQTLYMEPEPCVALNNTEARLEAAQEEEENAILLRLSRQVAELSPDILTVLEGVTALDVIAARAGHASWTGAARPAFVDEKAAAQHGPVLVPAMLHPLLLQPSLAPLPALAMQGDAEFESNFMEPVTALEAATGSAPAVGADVNGGSASKSPASKSAKPPCPVDLTVPPGAAVVMVTGPNTGGKTASLKALGLAALMSKAGLFLPLTSDNAAQRQPQLLWFDKVLADVGDGQSLQQSLSTFSAHVRRLRLILAVTTPSSLVLLDEVGSGTDPVEGEALAAALLQRLVDTAQLTFATTHHAGLKEIADSRFVQASVGFDVATLKPTYKLHWGQAGASNALAIAEGLGFSRQVVHAARKVAEEMRALTDAQARSAATMSEHLDTQMQDAQSAAARAKAARVEAHQQVATLDEQLGEMKERQAHMAAEGPGADDIARDAQRQLDEVLTRVRSGDLTETDAQKRIRSIEAATASVAEPPEAADSRSGGGEVYEPKAGDTVALRRMGGSVATVVSGSARLGGKVTVRMGQMQMKVAPPDISPLEPAGEAQAPQGSRQQQQQQQQRRRRQDEHSRGSRQRQQEQQQQRESQDDVTVQTASNTVDVRGHRAAEALGMVEDAIDEMPSGMALCIVHGTGTGRLRAAIHEHLKSDRQVAHFSLDPASNGGCTQAFLK